MLIKKRLFKAIYVLPFILLGWVLSNAYHTLQREKEIPEVSTIEAKRARLQENISLNTRVCEKEVVNITSSIEKGIVERVYVKIGDYVEKGETLLELRREELVNALKKEELNLSQAKEKQVHLTDIPNHQEYLEKEAEIKRGNWNLSQAEKSLEDVKELYSKQAIGYREVEKQGLEVKEQVMNLEKLLREKEQLLKRLIEQKREIEVEIPSICHRIADLREQIKNCVVLSPISGIVKKVVIEKNSKVEYGTLLLSIGDQSELIAKGTVKESQFFLIKPKQKVGLSSDLLGKRFSGELLKIIPATASKDKEEKEAGEWQIICSIDKIEGLQIGMELSCKVIIKEKEEEAIVIPPEALYEENTVLIVKDGRLVKKEIVLGEQTQDQIEVKEGLKIGDRIVVQYPEEVKEGMRVKVK
ncbi:MAG: efflux RND transporter periplasmic adaptor subunit [bacterium]|nr:efflux RND transporter periplasmic adaptor subunit [bacterium]